jgi:hypothetical protein
MKKFYTLSAGTYGIDSIFFSYPSFINRFAGKTVCFLALALFSFFASHGQNASATWALTANTNVAISGNLLANSTTMTKGAGLGFTNYTGGAYGVNDGATSSLAASQTANDYLQFSVAPVSGYTFTISAISSTLSISDAATSNNARYQVQFSTSSTFGANVVSLGNAEVLTTAPSILNLNTNILVGAGQTLYFRIYVWGMQNAGTTFRINNFRIQGNVCPAVAISYPKAAYCKDPGATATPTRTGTSGGSYTAAAGLVINSTTGVVDLAASTAGTYTITYTASTGITGCATVLATTTLVVNDLPTAFSLTGPDGSTGAFCTNGTPATFTLSGSQDGVTYTFHAINPGGNTPPGQNFNVEGVGGTLEFVQTPDGKWSYKVSGKDDATGCTNTMEGLLTAVDGPRITSQPPASLAACAGTNVSLSMNLSNANALTWEVSTDGGANWSTVPNASPYSITKASSNSNTSLTISNVNTAMTGYRYRVMYGGPPACPINYSTGTELTVSAQPVITKQPLSRTACANSTLALSVAANHATTFQWFRNGAALPGATAAVYSKTFDPATDAGTYTVTVTGPCGSITSAAATVTNSTTTVWQGPVDGTSGIAGTAWELASNWTCGVPTRTTDAVIPTDIMDGYPVIRSSVSGEVRNLTINGGGFGAFLTVQGSLQLFGEVVNRGGIFDASAGTIEFAANTDQVIAAGLFSNNTVKDLVISTNVSLEGALNLTGALSFGVVNNKRFATNDYLTLKSSAVATARVADLTNNGVNSGNVITGNVSAERFIPAHNSRRWRLLTAPVGNTSIQQAWQEGRNWNGSQAEPGEFGTLITGQQQGSLTTAQTNGFDFWSAIAGSAASVRRYIPSTSLSSNIGANWTPLENTKSAGFEAHQAYLLFVRGDRTVSAGSTPGSTVLRAKGPLKQNTAYSFTVPATQSHALIGNPYASPIDFSKLYAANSTKIQPYFWIWRASLGTTGGYVMVQPNGKGGYEAVPGDGTTITVDPVIGSGEGFFVVHVAGATTGATITLQETHKSSGKPAISVFRQTGVVPAKLRVNLFKTFEGEKTLLDGVLAQFSKEAGNDNRAKAVNIDENLSIVKEGLDLILASGAEPKEGDSLQLRLWNTIPGQYSIEMAATAFAQTAPVAVLYDRYTAKEQTLEVTGNGLQYAFAVTAEGASQDPQRFVIYFRAARVEAAKPVSLAEGEKSTTLYPNPVRGSFTNLQFNAKPAGRYQLTLFAPTGQVVVVQEIEHSGGTASYAIPVTNLASGTYTLVLTDGKEKKESLQLVVVK